MRNVAVPGWMSKVEPVVATLLCAAMFLSIPISEGGVGLSWDALNHHIYLGWIAEHHRFGQDVLAAGGQSVQYPYLYWPAYKLAAAGASGLVAGVVLAALQLVCVPAVWLIARRCIEGNAWADVAMRLMAVALAFMTGAILSLLDVTSNDLMAATPLVWAIAIALGAVDEDAAKGKQAVTVAVSGLLAGVSVAFKFSNGPIAILLPIFWAFSARELTLRVRNTFAGIVGAGAGFALAYGYWGAWMWRLYGNPMHPFYDSVFAPLRQWLGWSG